jgi:hypothetical protein
MISKKTGEIKDRESIRGGGIQNNINKIAICYSSTRRENGSYLEI